VATVHLPRSLVTLFPDPPPRRLDLEAATVSELVARLDERWPGTRDRLLDSGPMIREHINLFVDGHRVRDLATPLTMGSVVHIIPAVSGGAAVDGLPAGHAAATARFAAMCEADERVLAAALTGSWAAGTGDAHSDLDLSVLVADADYEAFLSTARQFVTQLGEVLFLEDFDDPHTLYFVLGDGTEGELGIEPANRAMDFAPGTRRILVDKWGMVCDPPPGYEPVPEAAQLETLRKLVNWFWHDVSHFTAAIGRRQLWWAYGELEVLRRVCVELARLRHDFAAHADGYDKVDMRLPAEHLVRLRGTHVPMEERALIEAGLTVVRAYMELAPDLARRHGLAFPAELARIVGSKLETLARERLGR
jgi:molybdopterin converting factor small subunit